MNLNKIRMRVAGWFILLALKISSLFRPVSKEEKALSQPGDEPKSLRIETDLKTHLTPKEIALVLRNAAMGPMANRQVLLDLATCIEEDSRIAPNGTRGTLVSRGEDMKMLPDVIAKMVLDVYEGTRRVTREPGNLVEVVLSTVVTSNATTVDPFPITGLAIHFPAKDKAES